MAERQVEIIKIEHFIMSTKIILTIKGKRMIKEAMILTI